MRPIAEFTPCVLVFTLAVLAGPAAGAGHHVPGDFPTIQGCLDGAEPGDECLVAPGLYAENLVWPETDGITLRGAGPETVVDGSAAGPVITMEGTHTSATSIRDLTVTKGYAEWGHGAGIRIVGSSPLVDGVTVTGNTSFIYLDGTAVYAFGGGPILRRCEVRDNLGGYRGGGIALDSCSGALVDGCLVTGNVTMSGFGFAHGAGISVIASDGVLIRNTIIAANVNDFGYGGGLAVIVSDCVVTNCTLSGNEVLNGRGGGLYAMDEGLTEGLSVSNSILWGDRASWGDDEIFVEAGSLTVTTSNVMGGWPGTGNLDADPRFVDPTGDFHLTAASPCIDTGENEAPGIGRVDFDGERRIADGDMDGVPVVDMGADELPRQGCFIGMVLGAG